MLGASDRRGVRATGPADRERINDAGRKRRPVLQNDRDARCPVATPLIVRRASRVVDEWREGFSGRLDAPKQIQSTGMSCILVYPT